MKEVGYLFRMVLLKGNIEFRSFLSRNTCQDWGKKNKVLLIFVINI